MSSMDITRAEPVNFIPGTVQLVDLDGTLNVKHAKGQQHDVVLIPAPSDDPDDPLNWSPRRKLLSTISLGVYTFGVGLPLAAIYSVLVPITVATNLSIGDMVAGTGYMFLLLGWGCIFWQPLAIQYGKRPVYLVSLAATVALMVWAAHVKTNGQWIANKLLQGFFGAPVESLVEISLTDMYFTHERGFYLALYGVFLCMSQFVGPVIAGFISDGQGWEWVLYWCAILAGVSLVFAFFFLEETNYARHSLTGQAVAPESRSDEASSEHADGKEKSELQTVQSKQGENQSKLWVEAEAGQQRTASLKTFVERLRLFQPGAFSKPNMLLSMALRPIYLLSFPVIFYAGFAYGSALVWFNVLNGTASLILSSPPYNFKPSMVGLAYISAWVGVGLGFVFTGTFGTWFVTRMARRNNGIMEPEYRLWLSVASAISVGFGMILWGVGAAHQIHWFGLIFAMCILVFMMINTLQISVAYCIDSYRDLAAEAIVTVMLVRNTMSFAVSYGITPWVVNMGLQNAFIVASLVGFAQCFLFLIFIKWGKKFRAASTDRYLKYAQQLIDAGLAH